MTRLSPAAAEAGVRLRALASVGSTNAEALAAARGGDRGPLWVTARVQSAGRGRRGRHWTSETGNLYASLLLVEPAPAALAPQLSFVCALALHDALAAVAEALVPRIALKWPNDILIGGRKAAGILIEGEFIADQKLAVVAGMGVNCAHHPDGIGATDLAAEGAPVEPDRLFEMLSATMRTRLAQWDHGRNFAAVRTDWLDRAGGIGAAIKVRGPGADLEGIFADIDETGQLVLREPSGTTRLIAAGDVVIPGVTHGAAG
ncbi:MAG: biotin--[acetyl-CoA-carboxylase] ligase [Variibacter sp.]